MPIYTKNKIYSQWYSSMSSSAVTLIYSSIYTVNWGSKIHKMRWQIYTKIAVYLRLSNTTYKAELKMKNVSLDLIVTRGPRTFKPDEEATEDYVLNEPNHGAIEHICRKCSLRRDEEGFCDVTRQF